MILLCFFNLVLTSLRGIREASLFDPALLREVLGKLAAGPTPGLK